MSQSEPDPRKRVLQKCPEPGCPELTTYGRCALHQLQPHGFRGKTAERGYDSPWRTLREAKLTADPVCEIRTHCQGAVANEVDHILPIRQRPDLRLAWTNLRSACKPCHSARTARERRNH